MQLSGFVLAATALLRIALASDIREEKYVQVVPQATSWSIGAVIVIGSIAASVNSELRSFTRVGIALMANLSSISAIFLGGLMTGSERFPNNPEYWVFEGDKIDDKLLQLYFILSVIIFVGACGFQKKSAGPIAFITMATNTMAYVLLHSVIATDQYVLDIISMIFEAFVLASTLMSLSIIFTTDYKFSYKKFNLKHKQEGSEKSDSEFSRQSSVDSLETV
ncbi:uncharacterized protein RJT21DRAFT_5311 [Scheffersomyces amazonensis]|uniref:uncharacterized protein n=1 Tax=Scheffersomyces amazonensis TaxID=1078765 RepID=UPI00315D88AB